MQPPALPPNRATFRPVFALGAVSALFLTAFFFMSSHEPAADCAASEGELVIRNPDAPQGDWSCRPASRFMDPMPTTDPGYAHMARGRDAAAVAGPRLTDTSIFHLDEPSIETFGGGPSWADGYEIRVNDRLSLRVEIEDFEFEVVLSEVHLAESAGSVETSLVFQAVGDGVAHRALIRAFIDGREAGTAGPYTFESRGSYEGGPRNMTVTVEAAGASPHPS